MVLSQWLLLRSYVYMWWIVSNNLPGLSTYLPIMNGHEVGLLLFIQQGTLTAIASVAKLFYCSVELVLIIEKH